MSYNHDDGELSMGDHLSKFEPDVIDRVINSWNKDLGLLEGGLETTVHHEVAHVIVRGIQKRAQAKGEKLNDKFFDDMEVLRSELGFPSRYAKHGTSEWASERYALEKKGGPQTLTKLFKKYANNVK